MKRGLILGIGVLALAGMTISAGAADLPRAPVAAPPVPLPFSWTGCYLGGNVGGKWGSIDGSARHDTVGLFPGTVFPFNSDSETGVVDWRASRLRVADRQLRVGYRRRH